MALLKYCHISLQDKGLSDADLALLGTLGSVLLSLDTLHLTECAASAAAVTPNGVQRLAAGLGAGALPALTYLGLGMHVGDAGASALAAALGRGATPPRSSRCPTVASATRG